MTTPRIIEQPRKKFFSHHFIDWLTISEQHEGLSPEVNGGWVIRTDQNGEAVYTTPTKLPVEGSHSTTATIRCEAGRVTVNLNPSRFNRADNLFGAPHLHDAISVVTRLIQDYGIQPFTENASISRVDITRNHSTGSPQNARAALRDVAGKKLERTHATVYPTSVNFGTKRRSLKFYEKAPEMRRHNPSAKAAIAFAQSHGIIREEWTLRGSILRQQNIATLGTFTMEKAVEYISRIGLKNRIDTQPTPLREVAAKLVEHGHSTRFAQTCEDKAIAWANGRDPRQNVSLPTFYRYRAALKLLGIDIATNPDIRWNRVDDEPKPVTMTPIAPPDWYDIPEEWRAGYG